MINKDIIDAFKIIAKDKDIETVNLSYIIEELFVNLMHKKYGEENDNFSCIVNMDKGEIEIYQEKVIVDNNQNPKIGNNGIYQFIPGVRDKYIKYLASDVKINKGIKIVTRV